MLSVGQRLSIWLFLIGIVSSTFFGLFTRYEEDEFDQSMTDLLNQDIYSYFKNVKYFKMTDKDARYHLEAAEVSQNLTTDVLILTEPNGVLINDHQADPMYYDAYTGVLNAKEKYLSLRGKVVLRNRNMSIKSESMNYSDNSQIVNFRGKAQSISKDFDSAYEVAVNADELSYNLVSEIGTYDGNVEGRVQRVRAYEDSVKFFADSIVVDKSNRNANMSGNVKFQKSQLLASARNGEIYLDNYNKKLKYYALYDDVVIEETVSPKGQVPFKRKAFSERLEGYMAEDKIVLLGLPRVYQKKDVLKGNTIVLRRDIETIEVDDANTNFKIR
ncbi:LptA/OstA family protein [Halobacteriovorax sp. GFR7]|uniref:LptA/OstA family protein n=1 Tax=unclassified Halobacteriovorax TaxID=2639665 RepID=UPI003D98BF33